MGGRIRIKVKKIDDTELHAHVLALGEALQDVLGAAAQEGAEMLRRRVIQRAPGPHIGMSDVKKKGLGVEISIGPDKDHWYYQIFETGATAHEIKAKKVKNLIFEGRSGLVITKKVAHTGIPASPFLRPAVDNARTGVVDAVRAKLLEAIRAVAKG